MTDFDITINWPRFFMCFCAIAGVCLLARNEAKGEMGRKRRHWMYWVGAILLCMGFVLASEAVGAQPTPQTSPDLNGDGVVDSADSGLLLGMWTPRGMGANSPADLNRDGTVNGADYGALLGAWGALSPVTKPFTVTDAAHGGSLEVPVGATPIRQPGAWTDSAGAVTRHELVYLWTTPSGACRVYRRTQ